MRIAWIGNEIGGAIRATLAHWSFSSMVVLVLATGLACVLFMLSLINGLILRPLPFAGADAMYNAAWGHPGEHDRFEPLNTNEWLELRRRLPAQVRAAGYYEATVNLSDDAQAQRYDGAFVSGDLFGILSAPAALGRTFNADDEKPGAPLTVLLSDTIWRLRYQADPQVIGRRIRANAQSAIVIGVMPADFSFPIRQTVWLPSSIDPAAAAGDDLSFEVMLSISSEQIGAVRATLDELLAERVRAVPERYRNLQPSLVSTKYRFVDSVTRSLLNIMLLAVILVLAIACANAANLILTRTLARRQELAIRAALGARRLRLIVHVLAQCLVLAALAVALALPLAQWALGALLDEFNAAGNGPASWMHFNLDQRMALFCAALALTVTLLAGLLPAWRVSALQGEVALRDGTRAIGSVGKLSRYLVIFEVTLSCILLISAAVLIRVVTGLSASDIGIADKDKLLTARIALFPEQYSTDAERLRVFDRIVDTLRADPEVVSAGLGSALPGALADRTQVLPEGFDPGKSNLPEADSADVDDHFLDTYGIRLLEGRGFDARDTAESVKVAIVDSDFVAKFYPDGQALGRRFKRNAGREDATTLEIVGVIPALHLNRVNRPASPSVLLPLRQNPQRFVSLAVHTRGAPLDFVARLNTLMRSVEPDTPLYWVRSYPQVLAQVTVSERMLAITFGAFGVIALLLAATGLYALIAFNVAARTREIGLRRALGAPTWKVLLSTVASNVWQVIIGLIIGVGLGIPFAGLLSTSMPGIAPVDARSLLPALAVLLAAALLACAVPARRAMQVDPMQALRHE